MALIDAGGRPTFSILSDDDANGATPPDIILDVASAADGAVTVPGAEFLLHADYVRQGPDLKLAGGDGSEILIKGYFTLEDPPDLIGDTGLLVRAKTAEKLAGPRAPGQYAQAGPPLESGPIAKVEKISGEVVVLRADGTRVVLQEGSAIYQGDVVQTGAGAAVGLIYIDGMTMALDENTRLVIEELFYDPSRGDGNALFALVSGGFMALTGAIAKLGQDVMMFPRLMEWWALPRMADEFSEWGIAQYWDDERHVSLEVKERLVRELAEDVPWDLFILFGPEATWADAEKHVLGWGEPVLHEAEKLEALLLAISARERGSVPDAPGSNPLTRAGSEGRAPAR